MQWWGGDGAGRSRRNSYRFGPAESVLQRDPPCNTYSAEMERLQVVGRGANWTCYRRRRKVWCPYEGNNRRVYMIWPVVGILFYALLSAVAYACEPWIGIGIASCVLFEMLIGCKFID